MIKQKQRLENTLKNIHKNYNAAVDKGVFENVMPFYQPKNVDATVYNTSAFTNLRFCFKTIRMACNEDIIKALNSDTAYAYAKPMIAEFFNTINAEYHG